ncbi:MAG TPA: hypothetical protein VFD94_06715 [Jatrophihabitans sp.]|nr:hypothetical protein [Jatrophihabitans sp.]
MGTTQSLTEPTVVVGVLMPMMPYSSTVITRKISRFITGPPSMMIIFLPGVSR